MKKEEFMQAAALRLISAWPEQSVEAIAEKAKELTELIYENEKKSQDDYYKWWSDELDAASAGVIISHIDKKWPVGGYAKRLESCFRRNNIVTVGDLLRIGKYDFKKYQDIGNGTICRIDDALYDIFKIETW